jgi:mucin-2
MNWTADNITFYVDGQQISQVATPADMHQKMYILLDLAVGGGWAGAPDSTTNWSDSTMKIDYVRAYSSDPSIPAVGGSTSTSTGTTSTGSTSTGTTSTGTTGTTSTGTTSTGTTSTGTTASTAPNSTVVTPPATVKLSNAASATDLTSSFAPPVTAGGTSTTYTATQLGVAGVAAGTTVTVAYDKYDNVTVTNNGAWGAIKNVTLNDAHATGMTINNFVDTEITTAGAGAAYLNITGVMRGNIKLGDGANVVNITGGSNSTTGNGVNINAGLGGSKVTFTGTANDEVSLRTGNGNSTIAVNGQAYGTVIVGSGNNQVADNSTSALLISLGSGSNVMDFIAGAHATVAHFDTTKDSIVLHGVTASQVKVTASGGSTDIAIGQSGTIQVSGVNLTTHMSQISYA